MESVFIKNLNCFFLCSMYLVMMQPGEEDASEKLQKYKKEDYQKRQFLYKKLKDLKLNINAMIKKEKNINCFLNLIYRKDNKTCFLRDPMYFFGDRGLARMNEVLNKKRKLNTLYKKIISHRSKILKLKTKLFIRRTNT
jgi:hypothetical protein